MQLCKTFIVFASNSFSQFVCLLNNQLKYIRLRCHNYTFITTHFHNPFKYIFTLTFFNNPLFFLISYQFQSPALQTLTNLYNLYLYKCKYIGRFFLNPQFLVFHLPFYKEAGIKFEVKGKWRAG